MKMKSAWGRISFAGGWPGCIAALVNYAMVAVLALVLAHWAWVLFAPIAPATPPVAPQPVPTQVAAIAQGHWFGAGSPGMAPKSLPFSMKLVGVLGPAGNRPGFAIFRQGDGKQMHALLHQEIEPGIRIQSISAEAVILVRDGESFSVGLERKEAVLPGLKLSASGGPR